MTSENAGGAPGKGNDKPEIYVFFVDKQRYETDQPSLTAAQIKARVPNAEPGDKLSLEGKGDDPDRLVIDDDVVDLHKDKGPVRLTLVPSASFGA
jgi:hypothetical protein